MIAVRMSSRAADDFATIRKRMDELKLEQIRTESRTTNVKGEVIGSCDQCRLECVPCQGYCCD